MGVKLTPIFFIDLQVTAFFNHFVKINTNTKFLLKPYGKGYL